jgi:glycerol-3-phosphate dehydrogenase
MKLRDSNIQRLTHGIYDVLIVGGGINGAVSAAALAGKGARVALIEQGDFASFTSQQSSNLAWGGIKYMESHDFKLVRKLCKGRNHLIDSYPSRVQEIRFLTTVTEGFRYPPVFLWLGAWLYWFMGNCSTQTPRLLSKKQIKREESVINVDDAVGGFEYSDAYLRDNDARFVFQFIRSALDWSCIAANYVQSLGGERKGNSWVTHVRDVIDGAKFEIRSKVLVNATGPFVDAHNELTGQKTEHHHVFSKGIHLIVDRITPNRRVLTFFADDGRLFFAIPMGKRTCIGTTDTRVNSPFTEVTAEDRQFVLENINKRLDLPKPLTKRDVIAERCGVRPLVIKSQAESTKDWLQLSRQHAIEVNRQDAHLSIFGGKLTDCINVGDEISELVESLGIHLPYPKYKWYGEPPPAVKEEYLHQAKRMNLDSHTSPEASEELTSRLWRRYDAEALSLLEAIREDPSQAKILIKGTEYLRCEIQQAKRREMIVKLEDFLRRRSKIALVVRQEDIKNAPGLREACEILFGDQAQAKYDEYFQGENLTRDGAGR